MGRKKKTAEPESIGLFELPDKNGALARYKQASDAFKKMLKEKAEAKKASV